VSSEAAAPSNVETPVRLFARANAARRAGAVSPALVLYRKLMTAFAGSREAQTSAVIVGRLLLDTQGSAAEALASFDRYAAEAPSGNLAEEALLGRAEALARLNRRADEAQALRALLERFPTTAYRARAEARLSEMSLPAP
jgi:outer membrane protein assembly factor BamD (BamD/ComL family)